jgi:hypothetical protein
MGEIRDVVDAVLFRESAPFVTGKSCMSMAARAPVIDTARERAEPPAPALAGRTTAR